MRDLSSDDFHKYNHKIQNQIIGNINYIFHKK